MTTQNTHPVWRSTSKDMDIATSPQDLFTISGPIVVRSLTAVVVENLGGASSLSVDNAGGTTFITSNTIEAATGSLFALGTAGGAARVSASGLGWVWSNINDGIFPATTIRQVVASPTTGRLRWFILWRPLGENDQVTVL